MTLDEAKALVQQVPHWHHTFEIYPGVMTPGSYQPSFLLDKMALPDRMDGLSVLDIGTSDGFFALEVARRGARVVAIDYRGKRDHGFYVMEQLNAVQIEYHQMNIYDLPEKRLGVFDVVIFLGVLYHLPDMLRALHMIRQNCGGALYVETHSDNEFAPNVAAARYYKSASLANDYTNFWSPNRLCVLDMLHDAGFDAERDEMWGDRLFVAARAANATGVRAQKMRLGYGLINS